VADGGGADGYEVAGELLELLVMVGHDRRGAALVEAFVAGGHVSLHRVEVGARRGHVAALERSVHVLQARLDVAVGLGAVVERLLGRHLNPRRVHPVRRRVHRHDDLLPHRLHRQPQHALAVAWLRRHRVAVEARDRRLAVVRVRRPAAHALDHRVQHINVRRRRLDHSPEGLHR
jgi:hypothetical protein